MLAPGLKKERGVGALVDRFMKLQGCQGFIEGKVTKGLGVVLAPMGKVSYVLASFLFTQAGKSLSKEEGKEMRVVGPWGAGENCWELIKA